MARDLVPSEIDALTKSESILRFAAENVKDLPQTTVSSICAALDAQQAKAWDQQIATSFWSAFNSLCTQIKPVTVDALSANLLQIPRPKWMFWARSPVMFSISRRSAARYLFLLMFLLCVAVVLGFTVSTAAKLSSELDKLIESCNQLTEKMVSEVDLLEPAIGQKQFSTVETKNQKDIALLQNQLAQQDYLLEQLLQKSDILWRMSSFGFVGRPYTSGGFKPAENISELRDAIRNYREIRNKISSDELNTSVIEGVLGSSVLPIILGLMGACAYIVRLISDEIRDTTFSRTSPIRHLVRVALGGLAGVAIGFGGIASAAGLSPSALAFVAGYAIEPVFATFDSIAEKFRR